MRIFSTSFEPNYTALSQFVEVARNADHSLTVVREKRKPTKQQRNIHLAGGLPSREEAFIHNF